MALLGAAVSTLVNTVALPRSYFRGEQTSPSWFFFEYHGLGVEFNSIIQIIEKND
jgi:hypothetical protein